MSAVPIPEVGGPFADLEVEALVAGGRVVLTLRGLADLDVWVADSYYRETDPAVLGADLARAIRLLLARRHDALAAADALGAPLVSGSRLATELAAFNEEQDAFAAESASPDGAIRLRTLGMREFAVDLAPDLARRYDVTAFCAAARDVGLGLVGQRVQSTLRLRMEHFQRDVAEGRVTLL
jgi:hypothetical protein